MIPFEKRIELLKDVIEDMALDFDVFVDTWEGSQPGYFNFNQVWTSMQYYIDRVLEKEDKDLVGKAKVCYCVGDDMLKTNVNSRHKNLEVNKEIKYWLPLAILGREADDYSESIKEKIKKYKTYKKADMVKE